MVLFWFSPLKNWSSEKKVSTNQNEQPVSYKIRPFYEINEGKCMNKYTLEKTEGPITDGQSRDTGKIGIGNLLLDN